MNSKFVEELATITKLSASHSQILFKKKFHVGTKLVHYSLYLGSLPRSGNDILAIYSGYRGGDRERREKQRDRNQNGSLSLYNSLYMDLDLEVER